MVNAVDSTRTRFAALFPSVMLPMFLAVIDQTIVAAALPSIAASLGSVDRVSWIVISYLVATTIAAPIYGQLRDVMGSRLMMIVALLIFMAASLLCAAATSIELLSLARVLQGLGGGGLMTLSQALIGEAVAPIERARYQGWLAAVVVTSSACGPIIGGFLAEHVGWRSIFFVNIPLGLLALLLVLRLKPHPVSSEPWTVDGWGILYFAAFIVPVLLAVEVAQQVTLPAGLESVVLAAIGLGSLWLLLRREGRTPHPLLRLDLLKRPAMWRSGMIAACHGAALVGLVTWLPVYFRVRFGTNAAESGLLLLPLMIGIGSGSVITGQLVSRTGLTMVFPSAGLVGVVLLLQVLSLWAGRLGMTQLLWLLLFLGLTMGTVMSVVQLTVQRVAGTALLGAAAASIQFSRSVGAAIGTALVGAVLFMVLAASDAQVADMFRQIVMRGPDMLSQLSVQQQTLILGELSHAFGVAFFTIAMFSAGALVLVWSHPERHL